MHVTAIIAAGGSGRRFGTAQPKQLLQVGGRAILERSVAAFLAHASVDAVIVALPPALVAAPPDYLQAPTSKPLRLVAGGDRRQDSVANAFAALGADSDVVVIHDAARPFASAGLIARTIAAATESGAAVAAVQARDTVKRTAANDAADRGDRYVAQTIPRETIYLAQTPQAFRRAVLAAALGVADGVTATDEAALAERAGYPVRLVDGEATNIKITTTDDLRIAEAIAASADSQSAIANPQSAIANPQSAVRNPQSGVRDPQSAIVRVGTGYDLHRLVEGRALVLGGVTIPSPRGALGHSDADVACHAAT